MVFFRLSDAVQILKQALVLLDQPASQQLLLYRATNAGGGFAANTFVEGAYRQKVTFAPGQQPPYQIIAASQGSQCGTQLFNPYAELIRGDGSTFLSPWPWIKRRSYNAQVIVNALPANGQANRVSTVQFYTVVRLFGFINIRTNFIREDYSCPSGLLAVDGVAGGTQYLGARLDPNKLPAPRHNSFGPFFEFNLSYSFVREFCFVPTASALDLADFNPSSFTGKFVNGIASTSTSRTDKFIAQEGFVDGPGTYYNLFHTTFTARNSEWMFDVMENKAFASNFCSTECSAVTATISGPAQLCPGATGTYSISNLPAGVRVRWSVSTSGIVTPGSGTGNTFTVQALAGADGSTSIQATLVSTAGGCELPLAEFPVRVGSSQVGIGIYGGCGGLPATFTADGLNIGTNFRWTIDGRAQSQYDNQAQITYTLSNTAASTQVGVTVAGTCPGAGTLAATYNVVIEHGTGCANELTAPQPAQPTVSIYPNPAHESLYVRLENVDTARPTTVRLFDGQGRLALEQSSKGDATIKVKVNKLLPGLYFVHVLRGSEVLTRQQLRLQ